MTEFARDIEYVSKIGAIRYRCPLDTCPWVHDEPTYGPFRMTVETDPATGDLDFDGAFKRRHAEQNEKIEQVMREHMETHTVDEWAKQVHGMRVKQEQLEVGLRRAEQAIDDSGRRARVYDPAEIERIMRPMRKANIQITGLDR